MATTAGICASANARVGFADGMALLRAGRPAIDVVEAVIRLVEDNASDTSVGYGGLPNMLGEVELDASIMDGATLATGAVGCVRGFRYPISIARRVMEELPHVLLVGHGAERFAREIGAEQRDMLSPEARRQWEEHVGRRFHSDTSDEERYFRPIRAWISELADQHESHETVDVLVRDLYGHLASGVSTSGFAWKYPGRIGDSPVIGAGNYVDDRYAAAACTGRGEMAIRAGTARSVVLYVKMGMSIDGACAAAMEDLSSVIDPYAGGMNIVAMDAGGRPTGYTNRTGSFVYQSVDMIDVDERPRSIIRTG